MPIDSFQYCKERNERILCFCLLLLLFSSPCGVFLWQTVYSKRGPVDQEEVKVEQAACFADCVVQIVVSKGGKITRIALARRCVVEFAHATWIGPIAGVFVDGTFCGQTRVAYDTSSGKPVPFEHVQQALAESIIRDYAVTPAELKAAGGDLFNWATYPGDGTPRRSMDEFRKRYGR